MKNEGVYDIMKISMIEPIAVSEELLNELAAPIRALGHEVELCLMPLSVDEKAARAMSADALIIANSPLSGELVENSNKLKFISVAFTGVDHVPADVCKNKGIVVSNAQGYATVAVTELVFGMLFAKMRNLLPCDPRTREGGTKDGLVGNELSGKTFGIVGYGAIGQAVAAVAKVFGCKVLVYTRSKSAGTIEDGVEFVALDDLFKTSDVISLHTPLTDQTRRMVDAEKIALMKPTSILINTARGAVVDPKALTEALDNGKIAAACIDVFDLEPPLPADEPLLKSKNSILAPHVGFATKESMVKRAKIVFDNVTAWLEGKPTNVKI